MSKGLWLLAWGVWMASGVASAQRGRSPAKKDVNPVGHSEAVIAEGHAIYNRTCTACHGLDGTLGDRGPALGGGRRYGRTTDAAIFDAIQKGIPGTLMPPAGLAEMDIWKVVAYIRSLRATAADAFVKGDVAHGEQIFWGQGKCGECHMIRGRGGLLGPDLSNLGGQRTLRVIEDALTKPKPHIPRGYKPVEIETVDGRKFSGIVKNESNFSMQVLTTDGKIELLTQDELRRVVYGEKSLMPIGNDKKLGPEGFQDLLAFLSRQTTRRTEQGKGRGADEDDEP